MIIEDDPHMRHLAEIICRTIDVADDIDTSHDAMDAINKISLSGCPDLIFLDLSMPYMNGFDFLDFLQNNVKEGSKTKVVIITCSDNQEDIEKAKHYNNVYHYMIKPLTIEKAKKITDQLLN